ncbi:hypothetical protein PR048_007313 [Dryococelus australis]|uniref:Uncharacterized protein n=1 Tax=Dryococelus australis TaxID=614101 RepID=A0ABQ9ID94_9NEOP|nr:hypothetical protein PR048_007313 [Dryococelus australis]
MPYPGFEPGASRTPDLWGTTGYATGGYEVHDLGYKVHDLGYEVHDLGYEVHYLGYAFVDNKGESNTWGSEASLCAALYPPRELTASSRLNGTRPPPAILIEERYRRQDCTPVQCFARRGDETVDAYVSVAPNVPTLLGARRAKFVQPDGHLNSADVRSMELMECSKLHKPLDRYRTAGDDIRMKAVSSRNVVHRAIFIIVRGWCVHKLYERRGAFNTRDVRSSHAQRDQVVLAGTRTCDIACGCMLSRAATSLLNNQYLTSGSNCMHVLLQVVYSPTHLKLRWYNQQTTPPPPARPTGFDSRRGRSLISVPPVLTFLRCSNLTSPHTPSNYLPPTWANQVRCGNNARQCSWSAGFLGDLRFSPPLHSSAALYSPRFTLIGFRDLNYDNLIKTIHYLRSTIAQERLSGLEILSIESDISRNLCFDAVVGQSPALFCFLIRPMRCHMRQPQQSPACGQLVVCSKTHELPHEATSTEPSLWSARGLQAQPVVSSWSAVRPRSCHMRQPQQSPACGQLVVCSKTQELPHEATSTEPGLWSARELQ